jgi:putative DNA primase/helicase
MLAIGVLLNGAEIRWVSWPDAPIKGDAADTTADHVRQLVADAVEHAPVVEAEPAETTEGDAEPVADRHTEGGAGDAFANLEWPDLRHCGELHRWHVWDGVCWRQDATGETDRRAQSLVRDLYRKASLADDDKERRQLVAWARKLDTARATSSMMEWASTDARIALRADAFDRDVELLNTPSGSLDLRTFDLCEHRQEDLVTICTPTPYDPTARSDAWERHLEHFLPDADVRRQVQRDLGLALSGGNLAEVLTVWYGHGANAKSTTLEVIRRVLGPDYSCEAAPNLLIQRQYEQHPTELAHLRGKRLVTSSEIPAGARLDEAKVKSLTGGGSQTARYSRADYISFPRTWSLVLDCNSRPIISGTDLAIWRRVRVIPWTVSAEGWAGRKPQADVIAELMADAPAILRWLVDGLRDWRRDPDWIAERVTAATATYRAEQDRLAGWIAECCNVDPLASAPFKDLWTSYGAWCEESREKPLGRDTFRDRLTEQGYETTRTRTARMMEGIRLLTPIERANRANTDDNDTTDGTTPKR